jgi:hypothetical protein
MVKFEKKLLFSQILDGAFALTRMYIDLPVSRSYLSATTSKCYRCPTRPGMMGRHGLSRKSMAIAGHGHKSYSVSAGTGTM